jgi:hypothetical protein
MDTRNPVDDDPSRAVLPADDAELSEADLNVVTGGLAIGWITDVSMPNPSETDGP